VKLVKNLDLKDFLLYMIVHVALPLPLHKTFSYEVPVEWELSLGYSPG
jgi:hypothetical protein